ncbi:MAG TPA: macro domain-containing protein [Caldilineae bacterium]|jgi:putative ATPase|nr:macro domain-containing protein [Caldilineae bacterium]
MTRKVLYEHRTVAGQVIRIVQGDLTEEPVDAIVNAANEHLAHGGGVAGAIVRKGGYEIQEESRRWVQEHGPVRTGTAAITGAGRLPARYVIHAVGPVWRGRGDEDALLASAVTSALSLAAEHGVRSISLPAISSGIFGFPKERAVRVILDAVEEYLAAHPDGPIQEVNLCNIDDLTARLFLEEAQRRYSK